MSTAVDASPVDADRARTARFCELFHHFEKGGVCRVCCVAFALAAVEVEAGSEWRPSGEPCKRVDRHGSTCRALLEAAWPGRPARKLVERAEVAHSGPLSRKVAAVEKVG